MGCRKPRHLVASTTYSHPFGSRTDSRANAIIPVVFGQGGRRRSAGSIDGRAVVYAQHDDPRCLIVDLVHDTVGATAGGVQTLELAPQRPTDTVRIVEQWTEDELDDRRRNLVGEPVELPGRGPGNAQLVSCWSAWRHRDRYVARSWSPVT